MTDFQNFIAARIGKVTVSGLHRFFGIAARMPDVILFLLRVSAVKFLK